MPDGRPLVSVVVASYTNARLRDLLDLLTSLSTQSYSPIEIVFVGEGDLQLCEAVANFARERGMQRVTVLFNDEESGVSAARNLGIKHAKGDIIAFTDDDAVPHRDWVEEMIKAYVDDSSIVGVTGRVEPVWEDLSMSWFPKELYWIVGCTGWIDGDAHTRTALIAPTANVSYRREALVLAGCFSRLLGPHRCDVQQGLRWAEGIPEDTDLFLRLKRCTGGQVVYNPRAVVDHKVRRWRVGTRWIVSRSLGVGWSRCMLQRLYRHEDGTPVQVQQDLLRRILTGLLPQILRDLFRDPATASRQLVATVVALLCVAAGYLSFLLDHRLRLGGSRDVLLR